ncbi:MAG: hypoxanthine phosphoribosyltransferase [Chloroflexi bacterium]|nr:hypoxanthine phosphoribosyltransferase [Chloroflexota bacterium]
MTMNPQPEPKLFLSRQEIARTVASLAAEITKEYCDKNPLLIGILKGSFVFLADLVRLLNFPLEVDFIKLSSYGRGRSTPGELKVVQRFKCPVKGRHVLIVEDIVDTGQSMAFLTEYLGKKKPASLRLCVLTDKPPRRQVEVNIDYLGFSVPDKFLVGYGMDWDEKYRNLPDIGYVELEK